MRVVLAGGGTGGHVYPALAIGEALAARGHELLYYGDPGRIEGRVVPARGIPFHAVPAAQFPRKGLWSKVAFAWSLLLGTLTARRMLQRHGASFVLGVGGYISAPTVLAAWTLGIPRVIHEANARLGLANRLCARVADLVLLTFEQSASQVPGRAPRETVGCPVNPRVLTGDRAAACARYGIDPARLTLLVVGGSLGAGTLNRIGVAAANMMGRPWQVVLVTGPTYEDGVRKELEPLPEGVAVVGYEDRMHEAYAAADLVVCRAGSSTLSELCAVGKPSVLVPSPNVTDNHQEANARGLETAGAAMVLTEAEMDLNKALDRIARLLRDPHMLATMGGAARAQAKPGTAERVADLIEAVDYKRSSSR